MGCYCVLVQDGRILLAHWNEGGRHGWTLPGGGMEDGESTEQTAVRECLEETGLQVTTGELLGVDTIYISGADRVVPAAGDLRALRVVYAGTVVGGELTVEADGSTDDVRWFALDDLPEDRVGLVDVALRFRGENAPR
ncbi:NUDIX domain-containing protein [Nakamurella sp. YIM 132087]|uniref:NUDIX domain-containing protein n=1 Tax=Nakamurella alba TaxID=2665158 RepID=A0A7K1FJV4_9ACTN|nr:NUDIX domain-containing protein [Nakamurella alba]